MSRERFVVRSHKPWWAGLGTALAIVLLGTAGWLVYRQGSESAESACVAARGDQDRLQVVSQNLTAENAALRERVAVLERVKQIERKAYADVDETLNDLQDEIVQLKEELAFYRSLVVSTTKGKGLQIQSFDVQGNGSDGEYRYRLVLTQSRKSAKVISGTVQLSVSGDQRGTEKQLSFAELTGRRSHDLRFRFKNFQKIEGQLILPVGFVPQQVLVRVSTEGKRPLKAEKTFDWPGAVG